MPETSTSIPLADEIRDLRNELRDLRDRGDASIRTQMQVETIGKEVSDLRARSDRQFWLLLGGVLLAPPATIVGGAAIAPAPIVQATTVTPQLMSQILQEFRSKGIEIPDPASAQAPRRANPPGIGNS